MCCLIFGNTVLNFYNTPLGLADDSPPPIEALQEDMLVSIADALANPSGSDLRSLRLVDKRFHCAVGQSAIKLRPHKALTREQLQKLSQLFQNAALLNLSSCNLLDNESLRGLHNLFPRLRQLDLSRCSWLSAIGLIHLRNLSHLEILSAYHCSALFDLPRSIRGFSSLQHLNLRFSTKLLSLPEEISGLTSLQTLSLEGCSGLKGLPEGIGALSRLEYLDLRLCRYTFSLVF